MEGKGNIAQQELLSGRVTATIQQWDKYYGVTLMGCWLYGSLEPWANDFFIPDSVSVPVRVLIDGWLVAKVIVAMPRALSMDEMRTWHLGLLVEPKEVQA